MLTYKSIFIYFFVVKLKQSTKIKRFIKFQDFVRRETRIYTHFFTLK